MKFGPESHYPGRQSPPEDSVEVTPPSGQEIPFDRVIREAPALEPTGNPLEDVANFERITGDVPRHFPSPSEALRYLVVSRQELEHWPIPDSETEAWASAQIGAIDRILDAHGVTARTHHEFDDQEVRKSGPLKAMRQSLEAFEPSGDIPADLQRLIAITDAQFAQRRLDRGETPVEVLRAFIRSNQEAIDEGVLPEHGPEARYLVKELFAIQNEVAREILGGSPKMNAAPLVLQTEAEEAPEKTEAERGE